MACLQECTKVRGRTSGVTRVGVTWGGNWRCHPYFPPKKLATFLVITTKWWPFISCRLVTTPQLPSSDIVLSSVLCKFRHIFSFGCHSPGWCHPGRSFPSPSDATGSYGLTNMCLQLFVYCTGVRGRRTAVICRVDGRTKPRAAAGAPFPSDVGHSGRSSQP